MIPVYLDIVDKAKKIINKNVGYMFELLKCTCEDLSYAEILEDIYPPDILESKLEKCTQTIKELYNMTQDDYDRDFLEPFYEYTLYYTILWWVDAIDGVELDEIPREYCYDKDGVNRYKYLNKVDNYIDFLFADWDFLDLPLIYSLYKKKPGVLENFLHINIEHYLDLMPPDIEKECKKIKERKPNIMDKKDNITININGEQINIAKDNSTVNAVQNNGANRTELEEIVKGITENITTLNKEDAENILDMVEMVKEEILRPEPKISRLKNCLSLIAPMFTIANGIPALYENLQGLQGFIMNMIR